MIMLNSHKYMYILHDFSTVLENYVLTDVDPWNSNTLNRIKKQPHTGEQD